MKYINLILIFLLSFSCSSQTKVSEIKVEPKEELEPPFSTQGEQEDYWTQELFKKEYKAKNYSKYSGEIKLRNDNQIQFGKVQSINLSDIDSKYHSIFTNGLLYPDVLNAMSLNISGLKELDFLSNSFKVKRFRFWLFRPGIANPQVYVFELQNKRATENTSWEEFIKGAKLTFFKEGWIVI